MKKHMKSFYSTRVCNMPCRAYFMVIKVYEQVDSIKLIVTYFHDTKALFKQKTV